jgi:twitching motility protein PilT
MKKPTSDDQLGMPAAADLWPGRPSSPAAADEDDPAPVDITLADRLWRFASPRPPLAAPTPPKPFPLAPPIPPLSFVATDDGADTGEPQPEPPVVAPAAHDVSPVEDPLPAETPWMPVHTEPAIEPLPATTPDRPRGAYAGTTLDVDGLEAVLRSAASRGVSTLYLRADAEVSGRVDGHLQVLDGTPVLGSDEIEMLVVALKLAHHTGRRRPLSSGEWSFELADVGRVQCTTFRDHRGAGAMFQIAPSRMTVAEPIGLSLDAQLLAVEEEGLIVVAGPRSSGKLRLMHQLATLITRSRNAYVISVQRGPAKSQARDGDSISQREVRGGLEDMLATARAALHENPDVLMLQELRSEPLITLALDAAASGQLVIAGFTAPTTVDALERILALYPSAQGRSIQLRLAQHIRGLIGQVLVPKIRGGRVVAQEVLLMTPEVAAVLGEGEAWQLRAAIEASATHGMVPLNEVLVDLVRTGEVRAEDAYRHSPNRAALLAQFKLHGIDRSFART